MSNERLLLLKDISSPGETVSHLEADSWGHLATSRCSLVQSLPCPIQFHFPPLCLLTSYLSACFLHSPVLNRKASQSKGWVDKGSWAVG